MKIPTYQRQQNLDPAPLPQADPASMTQEYTAERRLSAETVRAAVEMETTRGIIAEREGRNDAIARANKADVEKEKLFLEHSGKIDGQNSEKRFVEFSEKLAEIDKNYFDPQNKYLNHYYRPLADGQNASYQKMFSRQVATVLRNVDLATADSTVDAAVREVVRTGNVRGAIDTMNWKLDSLGIYPAERDKYKQSGKYLVADAAIIQLLETPAGIVRAKTELDAYLAKKPSLFDHADPNKIDEYGKMIRNVDTAQVTTASLLKIKTSPEFRDDNGEFDITKAMRYVESPEFLQEVGDSRVVESVAISLARNQMLENNIYKEKADALKGELQVDILANKLGKDGLTEDKRWLALRAVDRGVIAGFADAKARSDRAEASQARSLNMQALAMKKQEQREQAVAFEQKIMAKIVDGKFTDTTQIIKEYSVDNPYIQANVQGAISLFNSINNSPDLKAGLAQISKAAKSGLLDRDYNNNLYLAGTVSAELRAKYMTDQTFRGEKVSAWVKERTGVEVKRGLAGWLDSLHGRKDNAGASQSDLEYTAKKHGITVDEVKRRMRKANAR